MKYHICALKNNGDLISLYKDIESLENANALAQFAIHKKDHKDIIVICPSHMDDHVLLERGRVLDRVYENNRTFRCNKEINDV